MNQYKIKHKDFPDPDIVEAETEYEALLKVCDLYYMRYDEDLEPEDPAWVVRLTKEGVK